jgi:hydroxymethylpyrimidine/phosphomethylpyrimidine kinase
VTSRRSSRSRLARGELALVIAGSDPSGGAGLELDLKVLALHGVHGAAVASCVTLQSATGLRGVAPSPTRAAERQLDLLRRDVAIGAVKIGLLPDAEWVRLVARALDRLPRVQVVLDPVVAPTIGPRVLSAAAVRELARELLPRADLVTPNAPEAASLLGIAVRDVERDPGAAAQALVSLGAKAALLKGGHLPTGARAIDRLRGAFGRRDFVSLRRGGVSPRGTGCALASAIAAALLDGATMIAAIERARGWLSRARDMALVVGRGRPYLGLVPGRRSGARPV